MRRVDFCCTCRVVICRTVHQRADRITLHLCRVKRLQHCGERVEILESRIKPQFVILRFQNHRHPIMYVSQQ